MVGVSYFVFLVVTRILITYGSNVLDCRSAKTGLDLDGKFYRITQFEDIHLTFRFTESEHFSFFFLRLTVGCIHHLMERQKIGRFIEISSSDIESMLQKDSCRNETELCHLSNDTHGVSVRLEDTKPIPYFTELNVYYVDKYCTESLLAAIEQKRNNFSLSDFTNALQYDKLDCKRYLRFNKERNFAKTKPRNDKENLESSAWDIIDTNVLHLPYLECLQILNPHFSSFDVNDAWKPGSCSFDVKLECRKKWIFMAEPVWHYIRLMFTIEITLFNTFVCCIFLKEKNRSPVTILLSALAVSDSLSNLLTVIPDAIGIHSYLYDMERDQYNVLHWNLPYTMCDMILTLNALASSFHMISAALTVALCAQKVIVIMFPIKGKIIMTLKCSIGTTLVIFFLSHLFQIPEIVATTKNSRRLSNTCCYSFSDTADDVHIHFRKGFHTIFVVFLCVVTACTTYICCKLTCLRKNLPWSDSSSTKAKYLKSATTVVIICIVFIASELLNLLFFIKYAYSGDFANSEIWWYIFANIRLVSSQIGCSINFFAYLFISQQIRQIFGKQLGRIGKRFKKTEKKSNSSEIASMNVLTSTV